MSESGRIFYKNLPQSEMNKRGPSHPRIISEGILTTKTDQTNKMISTSTILFLIIISMCIGLTIIFSIRYIRMSHTKASDVKKVNSSLMNELTANESVPKSPQEEKIWNEDRGELNNPRVNPGINLPKIMPKDLPGMIENTNNSLNFNYEPKNDSKNRKIHSDKTNSSKVNSYDQTTNNSFLRTTEDLPSTTSKIFHTTTRSSTTKSNLEPEITTLSSSTTKKATVRYNIGTTFNSTDKSTSLKVPTVSSSAISKSPKSTQPLNVTETSTTIENSIKKSDDNVVDVITQPSLERNEQKINIDKQDNEDSEVHLKDKSDENKGILINEKKNGTEEKEISKLSPTEVREEKADDDKVLSGVLNSLLNNPSLQLLLLATIVITLGLSLLVTAATCYLTRPRRMRRRRQSGAMKNRGKLGKNNENVILLTEDASEDEFVQ